ncbi:MAG: FAD/NAD(P)-binding protein [Deltaproteobacteria bacterium]|nr:FAD/NAD(P)-binding protein [Deltaproteobacteria bacterium]
MANPYQKYPVRINSVYNETEDKRLKTFGLSFVNSEDSDYFFSQSFQPGQYALVWIPGYGEIPLGIASAPTEHNKLVFTVNKTGKVTSKLHTLTEGMLIGLRGPLGNGYPWEKLKGKNIFLIGGGCAFSTLRSSIKYLLSPENRQDYNDIWIVHGARTPGMLLYKDNFKEWRKRDDVKVHITVDSTSLATGEYHVGNVPFVLKQELPTVDENSVAIVCGPPMMIKYSIDPLKEKGFLPENVLFSLENKMKCGIGHCGRCSIGKTCICTEGPVFSMAEVNEMPDDY